MNLPPTIQDFIGRSTDDVWLVRAVAHEACRLQREADLNELNLSEARYYPDSYPLVVPKPK
jgi:hypothetical protein